MKQQDPTKKVQNRGLLKKVPPVKKSVPPTKK